MFKEYKNILNIMPSIPSHEIRTYLMNEGITLNYGCGSGFKAYRVFRKIVKKYGSSRILAKFLIDNNFHVRKYVDIADYSCIVEEYDEDVFDSIYPRQTIIQNLSNLSTRFCVLMAKQKSHMDLLINVNKYDVIKALIEQGYGLDILVDDPNWHVRVAVAEQGY